MKRLLLFFLLSILFVWPTSFGQQTPIQPNFAQVDSLMAQNQQEVALIELAKLMKADTNQIHWDTFQTHVIEYARRFKKAEDYASVQKILISCIQIMGSAGMGEKTPAAKLWSWLAFNHKLQDQYSECLKSYQTAIRIFEKNNFSGSDLAFAYKNAAQVLMRYSDNEKALDYLKAAVQSDSTGKHIVSIYAQMVNIYLELDSVDLADVFYEKGFAAPEKVVFYTASLYSNGAELFLRKND